MRQKFIAWWLFLTNRWRRIERYKRMPSFDQAAAAAGQGYLDETVLGGLRGAKSGTKSGNGAPPLINQPDFFAPFYAMLAVAALDTPGRPLRVLDFGGATGGYADYARAMFSDRIPLEWHVVETELFVNYARQRGVPGSFYTSVSEMTEQPDVAMFSGVLQYLKDWRGALSDSKIAAAGTVYIARTPVGPKYVPFLQTVFYDFGTVKYPGAILACDDISALLSPTHELTASWVLAHDMGDLGVVEAPAMIWKKKAG